MKTVNLPPYAPTLMESTRAIGYSIEAAIADIIDNSIAAEANQIDIDFFPINAYISILDNGTGMTESELQNAMQYGSKNPLETRDDNDLGRYGLGLKTASLSQCRVLTVITKRGNNISGMRWDLDHVNSEKAWSLIVLEQDDFEIVPNYHKLLSNKSGTLVVWQNLDKFAIGESDIESAFSCKMSLTREHLALVFHRFLSGESGIKKISIKMNELNIEPKDPFLSKKSTQLMDDEIVTVRGSQVKIRPYILPHVSNLSKEELEALGGKDGLRKSQGFYVYRNKRLLVWGTWFRLMRQGDLSKLARVQVDIPNTLDDLWTLDIKKSIATPPTEVKQNLKIIIDKISEGSKRTWKYRGRKETKDTVIHLWNPIKIRGEKYYEINQEHPLVESIITEFPECRKKLDALLRQISLLLPLNSLYIDLTNDEKFVNDKEPDINDVVESVNPLLSSFSSIDEKVLFLEGLKNVDMFMDYCDGLIEKVKEGEL